MGTLDPTAAFRRLSCRLNTCAWPRSSSQPAFLEADFQHETVRRLTVARGCRNCQVKQALHTVGEQQRPGEFRMLPYDHQAAQLACHQQGAHPSERALHANIPSPHHEPAPHHIMQDGLAAQRSGVYHTCCACLHVTY